MQVLDDLDRAILGLAEGDLPVQAEPFHAWAQRLGIGVEELLDRLESLKRRGIIRDFKAILRHNRAGITANAMVVWAVPAERIEEVGALLAEEPAVTHCYQRPAFSEYTMFSMLHGRGEQELLATIERIANRIGIESYRIYWSRQELKKTSMHYFGGKT